MRMEAGPVDHPRFLRHFVANERTIFGYLLAAMADIREAEDLLQEISVALWESFGRYEEGRPFRAWALGIARHKVQKWRERRGRQGKVLSPEVLESLAGALEGEAEALSPRAPLLQQCLDELAGPSRELVDLRYREGLAISGLAARLKRSVAAIEMALVRVRRVLRDCVERKLRLSAEGGP